MKNQSSHKHRSFKNDLDKDSDFDLDTYLEEQSSQNNAGKIEPDVHDNTRFFKNTLLTFAVILASVLWYFDWSPAQAWAGIFGDTNDNVTVGSNTVAPNIGVNIPSIEIPRIPTIPTFPFSEGGTQAADLNMSMTEYLTELKELGFLENQVSTFSARQLYNSNIPITYLEELNEAGYLADLSFVHITNYYQSQVPISYLDQVREAGFYDDLSFVDITNYYQHNVPMQYLKELDDAGYLVDLSFVHVTNYYQAGVTTEFLDQLKETGLYDDLNFLDVVDLYKSEQEN
ncbi:MAG: hypothetical protein WD016_07260 [Balneolaceae bacterium]